MCKYVSPVYPQASWQTFGRRKVLAIQSINNKLTLLSTKRVDENKWTFVKQKSAPVPRDWEDRHYCIRVFELLGKLNELLVEQEALTQELKKEQVGLIQVASNDTIAHILNK